ncbi:hypothetical protein QR680_012488 [Steinernema hermaphroditum]|uniref:Major facilitator superfamily (MFS) profile domain-containing protein n=1 Tax=Steinernema hermaphroditum TaxID=289476 RepID=A0AA39I456_9BILA|nr:hypothetical protein QR680_012488 [Steinernema hermaphroditum]
MFEDDGRNPHPSFAAASKVKAVLSSSRQSVKKVARTTADRVQRVLSSGKSETIEQLHTVKEKEDRWFFTKTRWQIALMANLGFLIAFGIRCNFGAAKARMTTNFTDPFGDVHMQEFFWSPTELGMLESSFFYGYAVSQIPGGLLAAKFAPNKLFGLSVVVAGLLNIAMSVALNYHPFTDAIVVVLQIAQGLSLGISYPSMHGVWRHWAPPLERSKLATTTFTGSYFGVMLGMPLSAYLVSYVNWAAPFYVYGVLALLWSVLWFRVSAATPAKHQRISEDERKFIIRQVGPVTTGQMTLTTVPWKQILTSGPVWAIVVCNFCRSWSFFLLLGNQLTYMSDVLGMQIHDSGLISALPQLLLALSVLSSGQIADYLRSRGKMSTTMVRKMFNSMGFFGEASFLCALAFLTSPTPAVTCLVLAAGTSGFAIAGFNVNHFDIAPRYAPILMGFSNGVGALAGLGGFFTEHIIKDNPTGWQMCFLMAMGVDLVGLLVFLLLGSGEIQEWAKEEEPQQSMEEIVQKLSSAVRRMSSRMSSRASSLRRSMSRKTRHDHPGALNLSNGVVNRAAALPETDELSEVTVAEL